MTSAAAPVRYRFAQFELQLDERRLLANGQVLHLGGRAFDLLVALAAAGGRLVMKDSLLSQVWGRVVVEENALQAHVSALRKALGAEAIATVSGYGYRLTLEVRHQLPGEVDEGPAGRPAPPRVTSAPAEDAQSFAFGPFVLVPARHLLLERGQAVRIGGRALGILAALVARAGELLTKRELMSQAWPDLRVDEMTLKANVAALRRVLGDGSAAAHYIATVAGRGYRFVAPVEAGTFAALSSEPAPTSPRHNLPVSRTRIFGRDEVIDAIRRDLSTSRIVSIVGAGGIGKTTVALAVAERLVPDYRDGVWIVDLSPVREPSLLPNTIATTLGLSAHSASMLAALCRYLRDRQTVVVLDSCEHMIAETVACVEAILAVAAEVRIVITTREPLRVAGERVRRMQGLDTPPALVRLGAGEALAYAAIQLFVERAQERLDSFSLGDAEAPVAAEICRRLDGLALAIELAATRVEAFSLRDILRQLDDRLQLTMAQRGGPDRHRTLMAAIDWSHELLSETERAVMRRLSVFAGRFDLDAACSVAAGEGLGHAAVVEAVASLVDKSLVAAEVREVDVEYRQWDTTRSYAMEKLAASGELEAVRWRHAEYCLALTERAAAEGDRLERSAWLARYGDRLADIRNALNWAFEDAEAAALGLKLTLGAIPFWKMLSLVEECRTATVRALADGLKSRRGPQDELILQLTMGATLLHTRGPLPEVKVALTRALDLAESIGDAELQLECLKGLSEYEMWTGDSPAALAVSEKIRSLAGGDADAQAGSALSFMGDLSASRRHLEQMADRRSVGRARMDAVRFEFDQRLVARGAQATVLWLQGYPDQALAEAKRQREEAEASHYAVSLCYALVHGSSVIAHYVRDYEAADRYLTLATDYAEKHGLAFWRTMAKAARGRWKLYVGQPVDLPEYREVLAQVRDGGFRMRYPNYLTNYGEALARQGDLRGGLCANDEVIALCRSRGQLVGIPEILRIRGNMLRFHDAARWSEAVGCYREAMELARQQGALSWELRSAISLVKLTRLQGGDPDAEAALAAAYDRFTEGFETGDLVRARTLLGRDGPG